MASKKISLLFVAIVYVLFANMQCNESTTQPVTPTQPDGLPLETQEGKNTFGCFWNDTLWVPVAFPGAGPEVDAFYERTFKYTRVIASQNNIYTTISIGFSNDKIGNYNIDSTCNITSRSNYDYNGFNNSVQLKLTKFIKPDTTNRGIVSGKFSGIFYRVYRKGTGIKDSFDLNDSIKITNGVFDVQLR